MNRRLPCIAAALLVLLGTTACGGSDSPSGAARSNCTPKIPDSALITPGTLTYSTNATLPPMQYVEKSEIKGMRIDLVNQIAQGLCLKTKPVNVPFDAQIPGVQNGRWDMINTGMFYTEERAKTVALVPYEIQGVAVSVPKDNPGKINGEQDLSGKTIAVEAPGYEFDTLKLLNEKFASGGSKPIDVKTFQTNADAFQALAAGQVEGVAIVGSVTTYYQKDGRFTTAVENLNKAPLAFGFKKDNTAVADAVAAELQRLKESGSLEKLFGKYAVSAYGGDIKVTTGPIAAK